MAALLALAAPPAAAGNGDPHARLRPLFQFAQPRQTAPRRAVRPPPRKPASAPKAKRRTAAPPAAAALPAKAPDAKLVLVAGDFFAQALARGLDEAFAEQAGVRVESAARPGLALRRDEPSALLPGLLQPQPAAVVIMLGGNDRQSIRTEKGRLPLRSLAWSTAYAGRASALVQAATSRGIPLVWVGLPAVASAGASADFLAFNELFRAGTGARGTFVDTWDGFVDEAGEFASSGPGVDGQKARLRTRDGIGFTRAGRRKLAFFVAGPLAKALKLPPGSDGGAAAKGATLRPGTTEPMPLAGYGLRVGNGGELLGASGTPTPAAEDRRLYDPPAVPGRADDFSGGAGAAPFGFR